MAKRIHTRAPDGGILDVGCGDGGLIDALAARGRTVLGLERDARHPMSRDDKLEDLSTGWAGVVFWHSLEHLRSPRIELRQAKRLLDHGGLLLIAMPNGDSLQAKIFKDSWLHADLPRHLVRVPAATLVATLRELGFTIERVSFVRGGQVAIGWLHGLVRLLPSRPDLYGSLRRPSAQLHRISAARAIATGFAATVLLVPALLAALVEVLSRRGGTVYVEARARD